MMHSKAKRPTKAEKRRMALISELGCVACRKRMKSMDGYCPDPMPPAEIHHLLDGGRRRGHSFTIGLCSFHHRGQLVMDRSLEYMTRVMGYSLYHDGGRFRKLFGSDDELLAFQNALLEKEGSL